MKLLIRVENIVSKGVCYRFDLCGKGLLKYKPAITIPMHLFKLTLNHTQTYFDIYLQQKNYENIVAKGEFVNNEQHLILPQCFELSLFKKYSFISREFQKFCHYVSKVVGFKFVVCGKV